MLEIGLYLFAVIGIASVVLVIWGLIVTREHHNPNLPYPGYEEEKERDALQWLDNEVRGQIQYDVSTVRGRVSRETPTLKGRVDMIEKHLGITTMVEPTKEAHLKIKKGKK